MKIALGRWVTGMEYERISSTKALVEEVVVEELVGESSGYGLRTL